MRLYRESKLSEFITKFISILKDLACNPIPINACLHYRYGIMRHRNWGDDLNMFLLKRLWNRPLTYLYTSIIASRVCRDNYLVIGSTLAMLSNSRSIVWGAGVIDENENLDCPPKRILAVRGPKTRQWLIDRGINCPKVYGDPAMLLAEIYKPRNTGKRYRLGVIPHYDDFEHQSLQKLKNDPQVLFIRMEGYKDWLGLIDDIASCDYIASSSLHGLIMAEAYHIPNLWIEISGKLLGGHFKFHDFFLSIGADREMPFVIHPNISVEDILNTRVCYKQGNIDLEPLKRASPFPLNLNQIYGNK